MSSLKSLGGKEGLIYSNNIVLTPLWYKPDLRLQIKREWLEKGIYSVWDVLEVNRRPNSLQDFEKKIQFENKLFGIWFFMVIKKYLGHEDLPLYSPCDPVDSYLNILLSLVV